MKTIATLVLICVFSNAFSAENNSTSLEKLMQKFEQNKITKVTVLLDQCTIIGKPIPVTTSLYKEVVFISILMISHGYSETMNAILL